MSDTKTIQEDADRLYTALSNDDIPKTVLASGFQDFSDACKNEVVVRVTQMYRPSPTGALLARLILIQTPENSEIMRAAFVASLRSADPEARKFCLYGLKELGHEALSDLALASMRDDTDTITSTALTILLPTAKEDENLLAFLQEFYVANKDNEAFHMSISLLEAHGIIPLSSV